MSESPPVLGAALGAEAIARSGRRRSQRILTRATNWLLDEQDPRGLWKERGLQPPFLTAAVLQALQPSNAPQAAGLRAVHAMLRRSRQLAVEDGVEARQLSVIAAHAALEAFTYVLLDQPTINVKAWDGARTIGLSAALAKLQEALVKSKQLERGKGLTRRNDLERRNEVVHKGIGISSSVLDPLIQATREFVVTYEQQLLHHCDLAGSFVADESRGRRYSPRHGDDDLGPCSEQRAELGEVGAVGRTSVRHGIRPASAPRTCGSRSDWPVAILLQPAGTPRPWRSEPGAPMYSRSPQWAANPRT
jgi:hypothetical protein